MNLSHISKKMKLLSLGVATVFAAGVFAGCGGSQQAGSSSGKTYKIGVVQLVEHNALDAANKGFVDGLKERGYEQDKNV